MFGEAQTKKCGKFVKVNNHRKMWLVLPPLACFLDTWCQYMRPLRCRWRQNAYASHGTPARMSMCATKHMRLKTRKNHQQHHPQQAYLFRCATQVLGESLQGMVILTESHFDEVLRQLFEHKHPVKECVPLSRVVSMCDNPDNHGACNGRSDLGKYHHHGGEHRSL